MTIASGSNQRSTGAADYFRYVLKPNKEAFFGTSSTFASALNLATSLYHFHEWLFEEFKLQLDAEFGTTFGGKGAFWQAVEAENTLFGYIRDVTNASKHVKIDRRASTGMTHIANTYIITIGSGGYGVGSGYGQTFYGGGPKVVFDDSGSQIGFDNCASALFTHWESLLTKLTSPGSP